MSDKQFCVTFAGVVGSSKTPIAYYLSQRFNLPILNNDAIRTEVIEDYLELNQDEFEKRRNIRGNQLLQSGDSFIFDTSIDRGWKELKDYLNRYDYKYFIISLDLTKDLLTKLYQAKGYTDSLLRLDQLILDHDKFVEEYANEVQVHITDQDFKDRLEISAQELSKWLEK
jgi:hypothetical protein